MELDPEVVARGHAIYTRRTLRLYDWWVLGLSNRFIWRCPTERLEEHYRCHLSGNHLEVGVGTGFFLDRCLEEGTRRLTLLDANRYCLNHAAARLGRFRPELHQENALDPLPPLGAPFDSIGLNYLLHCIPGPMEWKAGTVFDRLLPSLHDEGTLFGSTILGKDVRRPLLAIPAMALYNKRRIFSNREDSLGGLMRALQERFKSFRLEGHGCVVLFSGTGVREAARQPR